MNAYVFSLRSPPGIISDSAAFARGKTLFTSSTIGCTSCHNANNSQAVINEVIDMKTIFPGDNPVILATRMPPLTPIENTVGYTFDDKMAVINASLRGLNRGIALPLLMDLARKPVFLHDNSVASLDDLLNPARGPNDPHPFYLNSENDRSDMIVYLNALDDTNK